MTIISASRRTDIPAFYADWFMSRVRDGYFYRVNPFNSKQVTGISLAAEDVDTIVFWTKNPKPMLIHLNELNERGLRYYFQFTLNPYNKNFEPNVPSVTERIESFRELAGRIGSEKVVWRYDPIILSSATPVSYHLEAAQEIAEKLYGSTNRIVFSFYDFYGKGQGRLSNSLKGTGIVLEDITASEKEMELMQVAKGLKIIANNNHLQIYTCSEVVKLSDIGIEHGACIDGNLIHKLFGNTHKFAKDKNQRGACGCVESADMGIYNTCLFKCTYCYANFNEGSIESNRKLHNPNSPSLLYEHEGKIEIRKELKKKKACNGCQQNLL